MPATDDPGLESTRGAELRFDRVVFFSDAVFAIAATLLVVNLRPPAVPAADYEAALRTTLGNPEPFITVAIGFLVIGSYWLSHRATFALLRATDGLLVVANLVFLFWIAMQPFFTEALANHPPNTTSVVAYASCQVLTGIAQLLIWGAALHHAGLLSPAATPRRRRYVSVQLLRAPLVFGLSIPMAIVFGPVVGMVTWASIVVVAMAIHRAFSDVATAAVLTPDGDVAPAPAGG